VSAAAAARAPPQSGSTVAPDAADRVPDTAGRVSVPDGICTLLDRLRREIVSRSYLPA